MGRMHMALKVPLCWDSVSAKPDYTELFSSDLHFYFRCCQQMQREHQLLTSKLAGLPGVTRCHDFGTAEFTTPTGCHVPARALLLELGELGSLSQQLTSQAGESALLGAFEAWRVVKDVIQALDKVHAAGYVYEDLKPANICGSMASRSLAYKLIDFSSCLKVQPSGLTLPQQVGGTTGYMAPEVEQQLPHACNADTWSLGE
jgi:serine/threonine protein kinase